MSRSVQRRPSSSLRRMPVLAESHRAGKPVSSGGAQEGLDLCGGPGLLLDLWDRSQLGSRRTQGDVASDEPASECVVEDATDDQVHLVDGLGGQGPRPVGGAQHRVVEPFEVFGAQPAKPLPPDPREDVALGLVGVAAMGAGAQFDALGGQPVAGEIGTQGERPDFVVAAVTLSGEPRDERFGFGAVCAGRVPGAAFLAGDGIESFVDDRVVAVPLAGDVSLHGKSSCSAGSGRSGTR
jgi:hypothetical protein